MHIRTIAKCTRMQWLGGMPLRKKNKMCGEISEMAEYVHHHANSIYTVSLLAKQVSYYHHLCLYLGLFVLQTVKVPTSLHGHSFKPSSIASLLCIVRKTHFLFWN